MAKDDAGPTADRIASLIGRAGAEIERLAARGLEPGLHLVATPIGNLGDITLRALVALAMADRVYCEDTRVGRTLLQHFGIDRRLLPYHEHNARSERPRILAALAEGCSVALISDAGTPLVSDPGYKLVREAIAHGALVRALPGPSATLAGITVSGLPTDTFLFAGFLPSRPAARRARLAELAPLPATLVLFEAPGRVGEALCEMAELLGPGREAALGRELTKRFEEVRRGTLGELARSAASAEVRGEMVIVVAPPLPQEATDAEILARLEPLLAEMSLSAAARVVAETLGVAKARVYDLGLGSRRDPPR
jgi:16S rRNA (cytidine1402-2'-O)-methyltransferase